MNPDSTLAVTKTCPKDGVHLSHPFLAVAPLTHPMFRQRVTEARWGRRYSTLAHPQHPCTPGQHTARPLRAIGFDITERTGELVNLDGAPVQGLRCGDTRGKRTARDEPRRTS